jgi:hypothetical protein
MEKIAKNILSRKLILCFICVSWVMMPFGPVLAANDTPPTGCATFPDKDYSNGFTPEEFELSQILTADGDFYLDTAAKAIETDRIIIPQTQEVFFTFIFEGAGHVSDFGFMYLDEVVEKDGGEIAYNSIIKFFY